MKMRSRTASVGICIIGIWLVSLHGVESGAEHEAEPDGDKTQHHGQQNISAGVKPFAVAQQVQGLQAEGGKSRKAAADARHKKLRREYAGLRIQPAFGTGQRAEKTDDERTGNIDRERAKRKGFANALRDESAEAEPHHASNGPAQSHPKIGNNHNVPTNFDLFAGVISAETVRRFSIREGKLHCRHDCLTSYSGDATEKNVVVLMFRFPGYVLLLEPGITFPPVNS